MSPFGIRGEKKIMFSNDDIWDFLNLERNFRYVGGLLRFLEALPDKKNCANPRVPDCTSARYIGTIIVRNAYNAYNAMRDEENMTRDWGNIIDMVLAFNNE